MNIPVQIFLKKDIFNSVLENSWVKYLGYMVSVNLTFQKAFKKSFKVVELTGNEWQTIPVVPHS